MQSLADLQRAPGAQPPEGPLGLPLEVQRVRTFDTPEFAGMTFLEVETKTALNRVHGMGFRWSINPYRGCSHACQFCFARPSHAYLNLSPVGDFERSIVVKTNLVEVLRRELAKPSWQGDSIAMGTNTDPYQRCEGRYRLMPGVIKALTDYRTPFSILTKGTLITRDVEALRAAAGATEVSAAFTIAMLDEGLWRDAEPGTPSPKARVDAVRRLNDAGIPTGVMVAPIMPGLNDAPEQLEALVDQVVAAGATHVTPIVLHLRRRSPPPGQVPKWVSVRDAFWPWLEAHHPDLVDLYERLYRRGAYADKAYRDEVTGVVERARAAAYRRHGLPRRPRRTGQDRGPAAGSGAPAPQQPPLF